MYSEKVKNFLKKLMKYNDAEVHDEAHELEHAFSDNSITHLDNFVYGKPSRYIPGYIG